MAGWGSEHSYRFTLLRSITLFALYLVAHALDNDHIPFNLDSCLISDIANRYFISCASAWLKKSWLNPHIVWDRDIVAGSSHMPVGSALVIKCRPNHEGPFYLLASAFELDVSYFGAIRACACWTGKIASLIFVYRNSRNTKTKYYCNTGWFSKRPEPFWKLTIDVTKGAWWAPRSWGFFYTSRWHGVNLNHRIYSRGLCLLRWEFRSY